MLPVAVIQTAAPKGCSVTYQTASLEEQFASSSETGGPVLGKTTLWVSNCILGHQE